VLVADYPDSLGQLAPTGGKPLSASEARLVAAWDAEQRGDRWEVQEEWDRYARVLIDAGPGKKREQDHRLRVALALRRCDFKYDVLSGVSPSPEPVELERLICAQLEESLNWDPEDRDVHLRLIAYYGRGGRRKEARRLLVQATRRWPEDSRVLTAALDDAVAAGSFKKAAGLARRILALDPINREARERLVEAHLSHARKQTLKARRDLAHKELAAAREWASTAQTRNQIELTAALMELIEDADKGAARLRDLLEQLGGGLAGRLELALGGESLQLEPRKLIRTAGLGKTAPPGRDDLLATLARLRSHIDGGGRISRGLGSFLAAPLQGAPWTTLERGATEAACETLRRCGLHEVRLSVARAALKRWKGEPVFELHAFEAKRGTGTRSGSDRDIDRLERAQDRAHEQGDTRTALRIERVLADLSPFASMRPPFGAPHSPADSLPVPDTEMIRTMIGLLGLEKVLDMIGLPGSLKKEIREVARQSGDEAVADALVAMIDLLVEGLESEYFPPQPGPTPVTPPDPKRRGRSNTEKQPDGNEDYPSQLDLFE
jgi:tetratricopeptide (TPR) repeat protein